MKSATMLPNEVKSPFISFLRSFISSLAKRLHFFIRPAGATSLKKPRLSTRFFHGSGGRIRLHFVFPCGRQENKINVFTSVCTNVIKLSLNAHRYDKRLMFASMPSPSRGRWHGPSSARAVTDEVSGAALNGCVCDCVTLPPHQSSASRREASPLGRGIGG